MTAPARPGLAEVLGEVPACGHRLYGACRDCLAAVAEQWFTDRLDSDEVVEEVRRRLSETFGTVEDRQTVATTLRLAGRAVLGGER